MKENCEHENVTKLQFLDFESIAVHGPRTEVWKVRCDNCGKVYEERFGE